jgi:hypothetical protein
MRLNYLVTACCYHSQSLPNCLPLLDSGQQYKLIPWTTRHPACQNKVKLIVNFPSTKCPTTCMNGDESVVMMVHYTQNFWIYQLCLSSGFPHNWGTQRFGNWIFFPSLGKERDLLCWVAYKELTNDGGYFFLREPAECTSPSLHFKMETDPVFKTIYFLII